MRKSEAELKAATEAAVEKLKKRIDGISPREGTGASEHVLAEPMEAEREQEFVRASVRERIVIDASAKSAKQTPHHKALSLNKNVLFSSAYAQPNAVQSRRSHHLQPHRAVHHLYRLAARNNHHQLLRIARN